MDAATEPSTPHGSQSSVKRHNHNDKEDEMSAGTRINQVTGIIVDAAMKVHSALGPGLLESAYEVCLTHEIRKRELDVMNQVVMPVVYDGVSLDKAYRIDLLVEGVVVEVKTVAKVMPVHLAQVLSYLRLGGHPVGLLLNFQVPRMRDGVMRIANGA